LVELAFIGVLTVWTTWRVTCGRAGALTFLLVSVVAIWESLSLIPTLFHGYVLLAVGPFLGRAAAIMCVGGAVALVFPAVRLFRREQRDEESDPRIDEIVSMTAA
jgi:uncharacterized membrane protein